MKKGGQNCKGFVCDKAAAIDSVLRAGVVEPFFMC
jgi:hypothetical protein